jgi:sterol desaturase/sphingolipid hydroxylase (fatty acid hydroxylase superfamily)
VNFALSVAVATGVAALLHGVHEYTPSVHISYVVVLFWSIFLFLIGDFSNYLTHMLQHLVPVLWELHKVHHSATFLNPLTTKRMHPLGDQFDNVAAALFVGVGFGVCRHFTRLSIAEMAILSANANLIGTILVLDSLRHSHFPVSFGVMDRLILSPHMHQIHHSYDREHWDVNFGNKLSIWDRAFGTLYTPRRGERAKLGLDKGESDDFHSLRGAYLGPLIKIGRLLCGRPSFVPEGYTPSAPKAFFERVVWRKPARCPDASLEMAEQTS